MGFKEGVFDFLQQQPNLFIEHCTLTLLKIKNLLKDTQLYKTFLWWIIIDHSNTHSILISKLVGVKFKAPAVTTCLSSKPLKPASIYHCINCR